MATPDQIREEKLRRKRLAKFRFKSLVRKVAINVFWLSELDDVTIGDNAKRNIQVIIRKKGQKGILTILERAIMNTRREYRTVEERRKLVNILLNLKCLERFSPKVRARLAPVIHHLYYKPGRVILREGHYATAVYFILDGEVTITQRRFSPLENDWLDEPIRAMEPGDIFGEVALLKNSTRTATVTTAVDTELLCVYRDDFNRIMRSAMEENWSQIQAAVARFDYFKFFRNNQIIDCCLLGQIKQFRPTEKIYSEDHGSLNFVYFILSGKCEIIQCLKMEKYEVNGNDYYKLCPHEISHEYSNEIINKMNQAADEEIKRNEVEKQRLAVLAEEATKEPTSYYPDYTMSTGMLEEPRDLVSSVSELSDFTTTSQSDFLQDEVKVFEEIYNDLRPGNQIEAEEEQETEEDSRQVINPSVKPSYSTINSRVSVKKAKIIHQFVTVGNFSCGSVFGLGEEMNHRTVIAKNHVQCLLLPRYWLFQKAQNTANIWQRTKMYLDASIPTREDLFKDFLATNRWMKFRQSLVDDLIKQYPHRKETRITDIPVICRIEEGKIEFSSDKK